MLLPFTHLSVHLLSLFAILGVALSSFKAIDFAIVFFKKNMD